MIIRYATDDTALMRFDDDIILIAHGTQISALPNGDYLLTVPSWGPKGMTCVVPTYGSMHAAIRGLYEIQVLPPKAKPAAKKASKR